MRVHPAGRACLSSFMSYTQEAITENLCFVLSKRADWMLQFQQVYIYQKEGTYSDLFHIQLQPPCCKCKAEAEHYQVMTTTPTWGNDYMGYRATNLEHRPFIWLAAKK